MPGSPAPDLMLIDSCQAFGGCAYFWPIALTLAVAYLSYRVTLQLLSD
jgi:hypothetical protein